MLIERIANNLGLTPRFIYGLAHGASHEYKTYEIPKRHGGSRLIHHPSKRLKGLQRWLLEHVIEAWPVHPAAMAYRKSVSTFDNAAIHADSAFLLRMDLHNFFGSIKREDIEAYFAATPQLFVDWTPVDLDVFCWIVCRHGALTIGAPTSPALANAICYELDAVLMTLSNRRRVTYSRYADDLFFSTSVRDVLNSIAAELPRVLQDLRVPARLTLNPGKTRHTSKRRRRRVTGITLGSDGKAYVGRAIKRRIRALIHAYERLSEREKASLAGWIAYVAGHDPDFVNSLIKKYGHPRVLTARTPPPAAL